MFTAVILAAGEAKRMGRLKQLLPWGKSTILGTVLKKVMETPSIDDEVRVVVGAGARRVTSFLKKKQTPLLKIILNQDYRQGMLTSVWKGLEALPASSDYILFTLGDKPFIPGELYERVIGEYLKTDKEIILPAYKGQPGHPVIINKGLAPEVYKLKGPGGLRSLLHKYPEKVYQYETHDRRITLDIDYYHEYLKYREEGWIET